MRLAPEAGESRRLSRIVQAARDCCRRSGLARLVEDPELPSIGWLFPARQG